MTRSPIVRFVFAAILVVFIVVVTFLYGNAERSKQEYKKEVARQEQVKKASEAEREAKKENTKDDASGSSASKPTDQTLPESPGSTSSSTDAGSVAITTTTIPQTGSDPISLLVGSATLVGLGVVRLSQKRLHSQPVRESLQSR